MLFEFTIILFILIVIFDASKDALRDRFDDSFFKKHPKLFPEKFWNPLLSWKNKWVLDENENPTLDNNGDRIPKKIFNINIPDAFTDGWHAIKALLWITLILIISINLEYFVWYIDFIILSAIYLFFWWLFYDKLLLKKK